MRNILEDDEAIIKKASSNPDEFVLKPQREGGGHNFYGNSPAVDKCQRGPRFVFFV